MNSISSISRRRFLRSTCGLGVAGFAHRLLPAYAFGNENSGQLRAQSGPIDLSIAETAIRVGETRAKATSINGTVPGPLVRLQEGTDAVLRVSNRLHEQSSIHWHGLILPYHMDGVPGLSYDGIQPGETFEYRFPVRQNGTYWYHSHSGLQEQTGVYGPLVIDAAKSEPFHYDREYVVVLSDWTFKDPHWVMSRLKKQADYFNFQQQTAGDFMDDTKQDGFGSTVKDRLMWSRMRMMPTDISDVTGHLYTYLLNGRPPASNWTGIFRPDETIRLRFINAAAMTYFDVRIPGLELTIVQADGQNVQPVAVDEFRISVAETFDVLVTPAADQAYTLFAESMDRSGHARGTLAPREGMTAPIPEPRERPLLTMKDMGMGMDHSGMASMDTPSATGDAMTVGDRRALGHGGRDAEQGATVAPAMVKHGRERHGPGNTSVATWSQSRLHEPGIGLEDAEHRVLVYTDLKALDRWPDPRRPGREIELHLTGNMERYMWSFDGEQFSERTEPIRLVHGERVRLTFVNDTMMNHPVHLHGMWMVLENGNGADNPLKHTINVKPAERLSADVTADAAGNWAFHCHLLFHMDMGMFRVVSVSKPIGGKENT